MPRATFWARRVPGCCRRPGQRCSVQTQLARSLSRAHAQAAAGATRSSGPRLSGLAGQTAPHSGQGCACCRCCHPQPDAVVCRGHGTPDVQLQARGCAQSTCADLAERCRARDAQTQHAVSAEASGAACRLGSSCSMAGRWELSAIGLPSRLRHYFLLRRKAKTGRSRRRSGAIRLGGIWFGRSHRASAQVPGRLFEPLAIPPILMLPMATQGTPRCTPRGIGAGLRRDAKR
jgi:hypothetical protein